MYRRHMLSLSAGAALACCLAPDVFAQGGQLKRIGIPWYLPRERWPDEMKAGWQRRFGALHQRGWVEGRNLQFEFRDAVSDAQGLAGAARQLVEAKVDLIMAVLDGPTFAAKAAAVVTDPLRSFGPRRTLPPPWATLALLSSTQQLAAFDPRAAFWLGASPSKRQTGDPDQITDQGHPFTSRLLSAEQRCQPVRAAADERALLPPPLVLLDVAAHLRLHNLVDSLLGPLLRPLHAPPRHIKMREARGVRNQDGWGNRWKSTFDI